MGMDQTSIIRAFSFTHRFTHTFISHIFFSSFLLVLAWLFVYISNGIFRFCLGLFSSVFIIVFSSSSNFNWRLLISEIKKFNIETFDTRDVRSRRQSTTNKTRTRVFALENCEITSHRFHLMVISTKHFLKFCVRFLFMLIRLVLQFYYLAPSSNKRRITHVNEAWFTVFFCSRMLFFTSRSIRLMRFFFYGRKVRM